MSATEPLRLYLGAYTASSGGLGTGVTVLERADADSPWHAVQIVEADDPSFLALTEGAVHAVSETTEGRVLSYTIGAGELLPSTIAASGGAAPCHVLVDPASGALVVANYTAGTIGVLSAEATDPARVTRVLALPEGSGPVTDRQQHPHAHNVTATPWGTLLVSDLGTDSLLEVRVDPVTLEPEFVAAHSLPAGAGPRHFAWYGSLLLVTGELDGRLHVLAHSSDDSAVRGSGVRGSAVSDPAGAVGDLDPDAPQPSRADSRFTLLHSVAAYDAEADGAPEALLSHVEVFGELVYVAVRGRDSIVVLRAAAGTSPADGRLVVVAEVPCGGRWPRHFAVSPSALYVANQLSHSVAVLPVDPVTGVPGAPSVLIETGSPACVVFA